MLVHVGNGLGNQRIPGIVAAAYSVSVFTEGINQMQDLSGKINLAAFGGKGEGCYDIRKKLAVFFPFRHLKMVGQNGKILIQAPFLH